MDRRSGTTLELGRDALGRVTATHHGLPTPLVPTDDGRLATSRGSGDLTLRLTPDGLEVERDAGVHETLHRVEEGARLPSGLPGRYANVDTAATWTITATDTGAELRVAGPLLIGNGPWEIAPIEGDCIRIYTPMGLYRAWLDTVVQRDDAGRITGLHVDGGRVKGLVFSRVG